MNKITLYVLAIVIIGLYACSRGSNDNPTLEKQWGEYGDKPGQFKFPAMLASDSNSDVYVVDQHNHRIQKFDRNGNFKLMWGTKGDGLGQFNFPYGIAVDSKGAVYVSDMYNQRIQKFTPDGEYLASVGSYGTEKGQFKFPYGLAIDDEDILYAIDAFNYRVQKFNTELEYLSEWGNEESIGFRLYMPHEISTAPDGSVILSDRQNHRVSVFSGDGSLIKRFGRFGEGEGSEGDQFSEPHGVAVDENGNIFICDRYNFRIGVFASSGEYLYGWKTSGTMDNGSHFPLGILVSRDGSVYVSDHLSHSVQKYK